MNERIFTELYKKAWGHFPCPTGEPELEKFAELIVQECVNTLEFHGFNDAVPYIQWMATNKLGVEE